MRSAGRRPAGSAPQARRGAGPRPPRRREGPAAARVRPLHAGPGGSSPTHHAPAFRVMLQVVETVAWLFCDSAGRGGDGCRSRRGRSEWRDDGAAPGRPGLRVVLLDRARFPRDKACGEGLMPPGVDVLRRLGLYDQVLATGARPLHDVTYQHEGGRPEASARFPNDPSRGVQRQASGSAGPHSMRCWWTRCAARRPRRCARVRS